jgi:hypothetical protein
LKRRALIATAAVAVPGCAAAQSVSDPGMRGAAHNVRAFGAAGDGVTDDTAAIQAALNQADAAGGGVFIPDGIYLVSGPLAAQAANTSVIGASWNARLIRAPGFSAGLLTLNGRGGFVSKFSIDGNGAGQRVQFAELGLLGADSEAANMNVVNSGAIAIGIAADRCTVRDCTIAGLADENLQSYGVWANADNAGTMVRDNHVTGTGIDAIGISGEGFAVIGNYIANCHAHRAMGGGQLVVYDNNGKTRNGLLLGNIIAQGNSPVSGGIELGGRSTTIIGNSISNQNFFGINIDSGSGLIFSGNTIANCGQAYPGTEVPSLAAGLAMSPGIRDFKVTGNRFIDDQDSPTQTVGVLVNAGASDHYSIVDNTFLGMRMTPVIDGGTGLNKLIRDNLGIDNVIPRVTAADMMEMPLNPVIAVEGGGRVTSFSGSVWTGRTVTILADQALSFTTGGNLAKAMKVAPGAPVTAVFDGQSWRLR